MDIKWTDSDGTRRITESGALTLKNMYRGKGRPRNSDYAIEMKPEERRRLAKLVKDHEKAQKAFEKKMIRSKKASAFVWKANAYIYTVVIGLVMLNVLADQMSKLGI